MTAPYGARTIETVVALSQRPDGSRLSEIAEALRVSLSTTQRALSSLADDKLVRSSVDGRDRRHAINAAHPASSALVEFALRSLPVAEALDHTLRANPAVEFTGKDDEGYVVVLSPFADPASVALLHETIQTINGDRADSKPVDIFERSDLRRRLLDRPELRERGLRLVTIKGSASRAFRDPFPRRRSGGRRLGELHPSLPNVSRRAVERLARAHGLARVSAFGSAVRADFRPDSDVDILIEPMPGVRLGVGELIEIREQLEAMFDRDVDVLKSTVVRRPILDRARNEQVVLFGSA